MKTIFITICGIVLLQCNQVKAQHSETEYLEYILQDSIVQSQILEHLKAEGAAKLTVHYTDTFSVTIPNEEESNNDQMVCAELVVNSIELSKADEKQKAEIDLTLNEISHIQVKVANNEKKMYVRKVSGKTVDGDKKKMTIYVSTD